MFINYTEAFVRVERQKLLEILANDQTPNQSKPKYKQSHRVVWLEFNKLCSTTGIPFMDIYIYNFNVKTNIILSILFSLSLSLIIYLRYSLISRWLSHFCKYGICYIIVYKFNSQLKLRPWPFTENSSVK